ncbi:transcription factor [Rhizina undulata]
MFSRCLTMSASTNCRPRPHRTGSSPQPKVGDVVHIDLGPSKLISRNHATISYDMNGQHNWQLHVYGRNEVKIDDRMPKKDGNMVLRSGSILKIAGVQMMFVFQDTIPCVANGVIRRLQVNNPVVGELHNLHPIPSNDPSNDDTATILSSQNSRQTSTQSHLQSSVTAVSSPQPEPAVTKSKSQSVHCPQFLRVSQGVETCANTIIKTAFPNHWVVCVKARGLA